MSILVNKNTKVITQGMTGVALHIAAGIYVDRYPVASHITRILCNCGLLP